MSARPFIFLNMAMTVDGKITSAAREHPRFTSDYDREQMDRLRAEADAIVIGAGTLRADDPPLDVRDPQLRAQRTGRGHDEPILSLVVSGDLDLDLSARFFTSPPGRCIVVTVAGNPGERVTEVSNLAEIWSLGDTIVDLQALVERLHAEGVRRLLVEGGAELNWGFLAADLFDELNVTIAPALLGGRDAPTIIAGDGLAMASQRHLELAAVHREGDELYCRYRVKR